VTLAALGMSLDWGDGMGKHAPTRCSTRLGRAGWQRTDAHHMHGNAHIEMYEEETAV